MYSLLHIITKVCTIIIIEELVERKCRDTRLLIRNYYKRTFS